MLMGWVRRMAAVGVVEEEMEYILFYYRGIQFGWDNLWFLSDRIKPPIFWVQTELWPENIQFGQNLFYSPDNRHRTLHREC